MKKVFLIIATLFCICSCTAISNDYQATIVYSINGGEEITETIDIRLPDAYTPNYICQEKNGVKDLYIRGVSGSYFSPWFVTIYTGRRDVEVISFNYKLMRSYEVSLFNGHEIK
jgi:hypothetical protein